MSTVTVAVCPPPPVIVIVQEWVGGGDALGAATAVTVIVVDAPTGALFGESVACAPETQAG